jgi:hypothetical protein
VLLSETNAAEDGKSIGDNDSQTLPDKDLKELDILNCFIVPRKTL